MSDKKIYTALEVARMILEKTHETLRKHEDLLKSKNSAHEIDLGEEPNNDEAECPESLKSSGNFSSQKSEKKPKAESSEHSEDSEMEDEPLSGDHESEEYEDESEEHESESEEESEKKPDFKKIFKKSESGMFTIQYMRLAKDDAEGGEESVDFGDLEKARVDEGKSDEEKRKARKERDGKFYSNKKLGTSRGIHLEADPGKNVKYAIGWSKENAVKGIKAQSELNRTLREHVYKKPNLPKSEEMMKEEKPKSYEQKVSEGALTEVGHSQKNVQRPISHQARNAVTVKQGTSSIKGQTDGQREAREKIIAARKHHAETGEIDKDYGERESSNTAKNRRHTEGTIKNRRPAKRKFAKKGQPYVDERKVPRRRETDTDE